MREPSNFSFLAEHSPVPANLRATAPFFPTVSNWGKEGSLEAVLIRAFAVPLIAQPPARSRQPRTSRKETNSIF